MVIFKLQTANMKKHLNSNYWGFFTLLLSMPFMAFAQIFAPEGLNMPGDWNGWTNYPAAGSVFRSATLVPAGQISLITTGDRRWQTAINCQSSGGNVTPNTSYQFLFTSGPASGPWNNAWRNTTVQLNTVQNYNFTGGGANNSITFGAAGTYTMNWRDNGYANTSAIFMYTANPPVTMSGWSQSPSIGSIGANQSVTVNLAFSATPSPQELFYVRYTTNNFTTSQLVPVTVNGQSGTATIPGFSQNTTVQYYVLSTTVNNPTSNFDMVTLRFLNNGGLNYSYTVGALVWNSISSGNWSNPATWSAGVIPGNNATVTIAAGHTVTLDTNANVGSLTIQSGATWVTSDGNTRTITVPNNGVIINNGTLSSPSGSLFSLAGRAVFSGNAVALNDVHISGELDVPTGSTVSGLLRINGGGFLTRPLTYQTGATLQYNSDYNRFNEWLPGSSGPGVPWNVIINSGTTIGMNGHTNEAFVRGNLTLNGTLGLSNQSGGNLVIQGNYVAGATSSLLTNTRSVIFRGSAAQQAGKASALGEIFTTMVLDNAAGLTLTSPVQINANLNLLQGSLSHGGQVLTMAAGTSILRAGGSLAQSPTFTDSVNLEYAVNTSPGLEWPESFTSVRNVTVSGGSTLITTGNRTINRTLNLTSGNMVLGVNSTLQLNGSLSGSNLSGLEGSTFILGGSGTAAQTIAPAGPLCHLNLHRPAIVSLVGGLTLRGDLLLNSGSLRASTLAVLNFSGTFGADSLTRIVFNGGSLEGDGLIGGGNLNVMVSQGKLRVEGLTSSVQNVDHSVYDVEIQQDAILELRTGLLVRNGSFSVAGTLTIAPGGTIESNVLGSLAPVYNPSTGTLRYSGSNFTQASEWTALNPPALVRVDAGTAVTLADNRSVRAVQIANGGTLSLNADLTVTNGGNVAGLLQVNGGQTLSIRSAALNVASGGTVRLEDFASLLDQDAVVGGGGSLNGTLKVRRQGSTSNLRYNFWSSPVAGSTVGVLGNSDLRRFDASNQSWMPSAFGANLPSNTPMSFGMGYTASNSGLVEFSGTANSSNTDVTLVMNPGANDDWNLLGNPYPSGIDGQAFLLDNAGRINGAVYFWDRPFVYGAANAQNNVSGADYIARNLTSGAFDIPSSQGFFVEAVGAQARFRNQSRKASSASLFRQQAEETARAFFALSNAQRTSTTLIGFDSRATNQYDPMWDAKKMFGQSDLQVYSLLNGKAYDIQGLGALTEVVQVPLGVMAAKVGIAQFQLQKKENWKDAEIWLEDKKLNRFTLVTDKSIALQLEAGTDEQRLVLHFRPSPTTPPGNQVMNAAQLKVWANSGYLTLENWGSDKLSSLTLFDVNGRKVWEEINPAETGRLVRSLNLPSGVYMLRIQGTSQTEVRKISW